MLSCIIRARACVPNISPSKEREKPDGRDEQGSPSDAGNYGSRKGSAHIRVEIQHKGGPSLGVSPERSCGSG